MSEVHSILALSDEAFGWYLTGLTDGEGCFSFSKHLSQKNFTTHFAIAMRADEAKGLLAIQERTRVGKLFTKPASRSKPNCKPQLIWDVCRLGELVNTIIPQFERFPLQLKKARDFEIWKECVRLLHKTSLRRKPMKRGWRTGCLPRITEHERSCLIEGAIRLRAVREYQQDEVTDRRSISRFVSDVVEMPLFTASDNT